MRQQEKGCNFLWSSNFSLNLPAPMAYSHYNGPKLSIKLHFNFLNTYLRISGSFFFFWNSINKSLNSIRWVHWFHKSSNTTSEKVGPIVPILIRRTRNSCPMVTIYAEKKLQLSSHILFLLCWGSQEPFRLESVQDFLIKLDMIPYMHLVEISIFSVNHVIVRLTKIMNNLLKHPFVVLKIGWIFPKKTF